MKKMADKIREIRKKKDYSQDYVAGELGMKQPQYNKLESGRTKFSIDLIFDIAKVLGVSIYEIIPLNTHAEKEQTKLSLEAAFEQGRYFSSTLKLTNDLRDIELREMNILRNDNEIKSIENTRLRKDIDRYINEIEELKQKLSQKKAKQYKGTKSTLSLAAEPKPKH